MTLFIVTQTEANGPGDRPHYAIDEVTDELMVAAVKEQDGGARFVKTVEARNLKDAWRQVGDCPACAEGLRIIREIGF